MTASQRTNPRGGTSVSAEENRKEKTVSRGVSLNMLNILMTCIGEELLLNVEKVSDSA